MNPNCYVKYNIMSGAIIQHGVLQPGTEDYYKPYVVGEARLDVHYVDLETLTIKEKTASPIVVSGSNLLNVPAYSKLRVNDKEYGEVSGTVELEFDFSGSYPVVVRSPQHLDFTGRVVIP
jgi:hypothetical protein